jgi:CdiI immunity protein
VRFNLDALFFPRRADPAPPRPQVDLPDLERLLRDRLRREATAGDATAAVLAFRDSAPTDMVARAADQAEELATLDVTDEQLDQILVLDLGSAFWPPRVGLDVRAWLDDVHRLLTDGAAP